MNVHRLRKDIKNAILEAGGDELRLYRAGLVHALELVDAELEASQEADFLKPIKPTLTNAIAGQGLPRGVTPHG